MNEIKEIFESIGIRIRSPFFGYFFFAWAFINWKAWFYLLFSRVGILDRFEYFDVNTTLSSLLSTPLIVGFLLTILSPWTRWFFVLAVEYPTRKRNLTQANSEHKILEEKSKLAALRLDYQQIAEKGLIEETKRDQEIRKIDNMELRKNLERQIDELRETISRPSGWGGVNKDDFKKNTSQLRLSLIKKGNAYKFILENIGIVVVKNIEFELILNKDEDDPIPKSEYDKIPIPMISRGGQVSFLAGLTLGTRTDYSADVSWEDENGNKYNEILYACL